MIIQGNWQNQFSLPWSFVSCHATSYFTWSKTITKWSSQNDSYYLLTQVNSGIRKMKKDKLKPFQCIICSTEEDLKTFTNDTNLIFHHMSHSMLELSQALVDIQKLLRTIKLFDRLPCLARPIPAVTQ